MPNEFQMDINGGNIGAISIDRFVKGSFTNAIRKKNPVFDHVLEGNNVNKGFTMEPAQPAPNMLIQIGYDDVASITESNLSPAGNVMPGPDLGSYDDVTGVTLLKYPLFYFFRSIGFTPDEQEWFDPGYRGNGITIKTRLWLDKIMKVMDGMMWSSQQGSKTRLQGIPAIMSASNLVGGVDQATNSWHRANITTSVNTLTKTHLHNVFDMLDNESTEYGSGKPDLIVCDNVRDGVNTFGRLREAIAGESQIINVGQKTLKYDYSDLIFRGAKVCQTWRGNGGEIHLFNTNEFYWAGPSAPKPVSGMVQLPNSEATEKKYSMRCQLGIRRCNLQWVLRGVTS